MACSAIHYTYEMPDDTRLQNIQPIVDLVYIYGLV